MRCPNCGAEPPTSITANWCTKCGRWDQQRYFIKWVVLGITNSNGVIGFCSKKTDCATPEAFINAILQEYGERLHVVDVQAVWLVEYPNFNRVYNHATSKGQEAWCIWA